LSLADDKIIDGQIQATYFELLITEKVIKKKLEKIGKIKVENEEYFTDMNRNRTCQLH
jgi:hypothetical protein